MADIVFGFGTSHSSQLSLSTVDWPEQAELDKSRTPWEDLLRSAPASMSDELSWYRRLRSPSLRNSLTVQSI